MNFNTKYKVTALKDVVVLATVLIQITDKTPTGTIIQHPGERKQWIELLEGETKDGLGMVYGVHPKCVPNALPSYVNGFAYIATSAWSVADLPKEFFGLFRLEVSAPHE